MQKRFTPRLRLTRFLLLICMVLPLAVWAQDVVDGRPTTFWDYFLQGGLTMVPLSLCAVWALAVLIEVIVRMRRKNFCPRSVTQQVLEALSVEDYQKAWNVASDSPTPLGRVLAAALAKVPKGREAVEEAGIEAAANVSSDYRVKLSFLSLNAGVAPMWGLFGTISGMIGAFNAMAFGGAVGDPTKLAGDIGEALVTTYTGLVIAIPCMTAYFILLAQLKKVLTVVQDSFVEVLDSVDFDNLPSDLVLMTGSAGSQIASSQGGETVACPSCQKEIKVGVEVCPHCKSEMDWS